MRQLVNLDGLAVVRAYVVEARELFYQAINQTGAVVIQTGRAGLHEIVKAAVVFFCQHRSHLTPDLQFLVEHRHFDVAGENAFELRSGQPSQEFAVENRKSIVHRSFHACEKSVGIRPMPPGIIHLEFHVSRKISKCRVHGIGSEDEIEHVIGAALPHAERDLILGHWQFFVSHPPSDFYNFFDMRVNVA